MAAGTRIARPPVPTAEEPVENSPRLPAVALLLAAGLALVVALSYDGGDGVFVLSELEIGFAAAAFTLAVFGAQGLISVLLEGRRLRPGRVPPRLTDELSRAIVVFSLALFAIAVTLASGLVSDWRPRVIGVAAGGGCLVLAFLLVFYKEAFLGDEAGFDDRDDGVPW
jgi:hypothetical protein